VYEKRSQACDHYRQSFENFRIHRRVATHQIAGNGRYIPSCSGSGSDSKFSVRVDSQRVPMLHLLRCRRKRQLVAVEFR